MIFNATQPLNDNTLPGITSPHSNLEMIIDRERTRLFYILVLPVHVVESCPSSSLTSLELTWLSPFPCSHFCIFFSRVL
ncbi:hypothetical protein CDV31_008183 [Fusarium ambrosium]|uniref:Uncharacterized protein n=1 Tax=Fusarium ambrosium TaxID=131363 RepID=A0A428U270_9HYPO|nr:hypothetical protein CDV31_008183 [Fusarium ambrosium]